MLTYTMHIFLMINSGTGPSPTPWVETMFSIAICSQWQSKTLFLTIFDLRSSIILTFSIAAYPVRYGLDGSKKQDTIYFSHKTRRDLAAITK